MAISDTKLAGIGCLAIIFIAIIGIALLMLIGAVAIGAANSWIMLGNFSDGWDAAWDRPFILFLWSALFLGGTGTSTSVRA